jgi:hypothetical protein
MGALLIVAARPTRNCRAGVIEIVEDRFVQQFVALRPLNASQIPFCIGLPGAMKRQASRLL